MPAKGDEPVPPKHRLIYNEMTAVRNNPIGAMNLIEVMYRYRLFKPKHILLNDTHASVGPFFDINPAAAALGGVVRVKPLAVLQVSFSHAWIGYFGTFGLLQSFDSDGIDYSDTQLDKNEDAGQNFATTGSISKLETILQAKVGPIAARSALLATRYHINTHGKPLWFDTGLDVLAPEKGWVVKNDLDLLWMGKKGLALGSRWTWTRALLGSASPGADHTDRVGPIAIYSWKKTPGAKFSHPTVVAMLQWYVKHPYRTGGDVHQGIPYFAAGFLFSGDLVPW